ncbi:cytochrome P450 [Punctularia strigosozonata HHB-11173 SS5]|uniref:cytochrome P450 n=1 Tax=Punctularia strigosozonata (strain HHB-11173) TaxID=741275 RepID=UPI0004416C9B|nr:cytochrome P450 [Punctularia strigosozonata HHB-11173 SS5]EIN05322.1 cytochrome P450 [Punctularia strigosozonata HHB-11173 SS5]
MEVDESERLPEDVVIGQMTLLIFAAYDTTSSAIARILYLLSKNQAVQDELRNEINDMREQLGDIDPSYDQLMSMPILDSVIRETLRLHPPAPYMSRVATTDTVLPLATPVIGTDGKSIYEVPVRQGQSVWIGISSPNRNKSTWGPDAEEWKPQRWRSPLPSTVTDAKIPSVYANQLTFLAGSRSCIGFTFAEIEIKTVLYMMLYNFKFEPPTSEISWKMTPVLVPYIKGQDNDHPQLPLRVSLVDR